MKVKIKNSNLNAKFWFSNFIFSFFILNFICSISTTAAELPNRIVSLAPNMTEILYAIGLGDRIVGVTNFCDHPEVAKRKPKIGGMTNPSLEAVVSLRPDRVVMTTDGNPKEFEERLRSLKIKTYVFKARRISELPMGIREMGLALGVGEKAEKLAKEIEEAISSFKVRDQKSNPPTTPLVKGGFKRGVCGGINKKKVLFIIWPEPLIVAGPGTIIDDAITLLWGENIASKSKTTYPKYSIEEIMYQAPDAIFIGKGHVNMKEASRGLLERLSKVPAVKNGAVYFISDSIYRLSPRIVIGVEEMARCLR